MTTRADVLSVIEAAYRPAESRAAWLKAVAERMLHVFGNGPVVGGVLYDARRSDWIELTDFHHIGLPPAFAADIFSPYPVPPPDDFAALLHAYRTTTIGTLGRTFGPYVPRLADLVKRSSIGDVTFLNATDPTFCGVLLGTAGDATRRGSRTRHLWRQLGAHIAAGLRLQYQFRKLAHGQSLDECAEAILTPAGRVEHATGIAKEPTSRTALRDGLLRLESARRSEQEAVDVAELWTGLCAGRWSLVEHFEKQGRRYFLAYRNDPRLAATRALTERERQVCTYSAMGHSNKLIAYSLGISISSVSKHLERARAKLGGHLSLQALSALIPLASSSGEDADSRSPGH
jgi:DNA-binding CsgD family transcriptional regulator